MIIALSGIPNSGKDAIGNEVRNRLNDTIKRFSALGQLFDNNSFSTRKFAAQANACYAAITGINYSKLPREQKEEHRPSFKQMAQQMKLVFGKNVWAKSLIRTKHNSSDPCNWIITDLRFYDEVIELRDSDIPLILVRIRRSCPECGIKEFHQDGCSLNNLTPEETELRSFMGYDLILDNDSTVDEAGRKIMNYILKDSGYYFDDTNTLQK